MSLIVLVGPIGVFAQQSAAVLSGRLFDAANGSPIGFASVVLEDAASGRQLAGTLTAENGRFVVEGLAPGSYRVRMSFPGITRPTPISWSVRSIALTTSATSGCRASRATRRR